MCGGGADPSSDSCRSPNPKLPRSEGLSVLVASGETLSLGGGAGHVDGCAHPSGDLRRGVSEPAALLLEDFVIQQPPAHAADDIRGQRVREGSVLLFLLFLLVG